VVYFLFCAEVDFQVFRSARTEFSWIPRSTVPGVTEHTSGRTELNSAGTERNSAPEFRCSGTYTPICRNNPDIKLYDFQDFVKSKCNYYQYFYESISVFVIKFKYLYMPVLWWSLYLRIQTELKSLQGLQHELSWTMFMHEFSWDFRTWIQAEVTSVQLFSWIHALNRTQPEFMSRLKTEGPPEETWRTPWSVLNPVLPDKP
jgi:hypothetical protein